MMRYLDMQDGGARAAPWSHIEGSGGDARQPLLGSGVTGLGGGGGVGGDGGAGGGSVDVYDDDDSMSGVQSGRATAYSSSHYPTDYSIHGPDVLGPEVLAPRPRPQRPLNQSTTSNDTNRG